MSEYIRTNKFDTNECPNIFAKEKLIRTNVRIYIRDQYIRIFEYSNIFVTLCFGAYHRPPDGHFLYLKRTNSANTKLDFQENTNKHTADLNDRRGNPHKSCKLLPMIFGPPIPSWDPSLEASLTKASRGYFQLRMGWVFLWRSISKPPQVRTPPNHITRARPMHFNVPPSHILPHFPAPHYKLTNTPCDEF